MSEPIPVYAILRLDRYAGMHPESQPHVTVKEILPSLEEAMGEVERLNKLNEDERTIYRWQHSRYFPHGRKGGQDE